MSYSVSVIIPTFNNRTLLNNSIESFLGQSLTSKELIIVDDGSTDNTFQIVNEYINDNPNIKYVYQENSGSGPARNLGIERASGEYVAFLDSDDWYPNRDSLKDLYDNARNDNLEIVGGRLKIFSRNKWVSIPVDNSYLNVSKKLMLDFKTYQYPFHYQRFIFKRDLLLNKHIAFPSYRRFQDPPFLVNALNATDQFAIYPIDSYVYRYGHKQINWNEEKLNDWIDGIRDLLILSKEDELPILHRIALDEANSYTLILEAYSRLKDGNAALVNNLLSLEDNVDNDLIRGDVPFYPAIYFKNHQTNGVQEEYKLVYYQLIRNLKSKLKELIHDFYS